MNFNVTLKFGKKAITQKDHIKYLGVNLDENLDWNHHVDVISKKVSRGIGVMYRIRRYVDLSVLKSIYYSLIYSHLLYAIEVWGNACDTLIDKLLILQKKAVRMMTFKDNYPATPGPLNPSDPIFKYLHILQFKDIYKLQILRFVYKWKNKLIPHHFGNIFMKNCDLYSCNTNSSTNVIMEKGFKDFQVVERDTLHLQSSNLVNYGYKSMRVNGPKLGMN